MAKRSELHLLPTGVFVVETKNYSGKCVCHGDRWFFQGRRQKYDVSSVSVQARNNARVLANLLHSSGFTVEVNPIIVFAHPSVQLLHSPTVPILRSGYICNFVLTQRPSFQLTSAYSYKAAERILMSNRARTANPGPVIDNVILTRERYPSIFYRFHLPNGLRRGTLGGAKKCRISLCTRATVTVRFRRPFLVESITGLTWEGDWAISPP
jgi:hypothetical protein